MNGLKRKLTEQGRRKLVGYMMMKGLPSELKSHLNEILQAGEIYESDVEIFESNSIFIDTTN